MRLKTAPRIILGLAVVGALAYGANYYIDHRPKPNDIVAAPALIQEPALQQPTAVQQPAKPQQPVQEPIAAPQQQPPTTGRTQQDAALNALLKGGTK